MNTYYIAYSLIEEQGSANQIQTKNTFLGLEHIFSGIRGIFLGNKRSLSWKIRKVNNTYFVDKAHFKMGILEKYFKIGIIRKNFFPYLFARRSGQLLQKDKNAKNIYIRQGDINEFLFYLKRLDVLAINKIVFEFHNLHFNVPHFYHWGFEKAYSYKKHAEFFHLLERNQKRAAVVTLTRSLAEAIKSEFNYTGHIEIIPDAHNFPTQKPKDIHFGQHKIELIYTGLNFKNRGVQMLIGAMDFLPDRFYLRLVGGQLLQRQEIEKNYSGLIKQGRLLIVPPIGHSKIKEMILGADMAILPTPSAGFASFTSPLKLFEYMAAGMPIIASDTKSFREILSKESALFFKENDSRDLADKIKYLSANERLAQTMGHAAFLESDNHTYAKRAEKISRLLSPI
ncbi:MAG: glycosyltransferase family 4 protein [bacterium]|nr:glycosyltransferase family 4 protein [bacterium]